MKKIIKKSLGALLIASLFGVGLASCGLVEGNSSSINQEVEKERETIYRLAVRSGYEGTYEEWLESIKGREIELGVENGSICWKYVDEPNWRILLSADSLKGEAGNDAKEVEFNVTTTHIQWRYVGEPNYRNLLSLDLLISEGSKGQSAYEIAVELGYKGDELSWIESLQGQDGDKGLSAYEIYLKYNPNYTGDEKQWIEDLANGLLKTKVYTVSFDTDCDIEIEDQLVREGFKVEKPEAINRPGYTFKGWYVDDEKWVFNGFVVTENVKLKAVWEQNVYNISFDYNGGIGSFDDIKITYNASYNLPTPIRMGYDFVGWYYNGELVDNSAFLYEEDVVYTAKWNYRYTISFDVDGGDSISSIQGSGTVEELPTPTKEGYMFYGWYYNGDLVKAPFDYEYEHDIELEAKWISFGDAFTYAEVGDNSVKLLDYMLNETNIVIPSEINGLTVTEIDSNIFKNASFVDRADIMSVSIPSTITSIPDGLLEGCTSIQEIKISDTAKTTLKKLFKTSSSSGIPQTLVTIAFQDGQTTNGSQLFVGNPNSYRIVLASDLETIMPYMFDSCNYIKELVLQDSVKKVRENSIVNCEKLEKIVVSKNVSSFGQSSSFNNCPILKEVYYDGTADEWFNITWVYNGPVKSGVHFYSRNADGFYEELTEIVITVENQNTVPLYQYTYVETLTFKEGITYIGGKACDGMIFLKKVNLPEGLLEIGDTAFNGCINLKEINIPSTVTMIRSSAFMNCSSLKNVVLPDSLTDIKSSTFYGCTSLESVDLGEGISSIGNSAFYGCVNLRSITIPEGVMKIEMDAFYKNTGLESVYYYGDYEMWQELTKNENPMIYADTLYLYNPISKKFEEEERGKMHTSIEDVYEMAKNLKPESEKTEEVIIKGVLVAGASSSQYFIKDKDGNVICINSGTYAQLGDIVIARGVAMTSYGGNVYFTTHNSSSGWYIYGPSQDKLTYPTPLVFNGDEYIDEVRNNSNVLNSQYIMIQNVTLIKENELETQNKQYFTFDGSGVDSSMFGKKVNIYGYLNPFGRFVYTSIELIK